MGSWPPGKYKTRNWPSYKTALIQRGSRSIWFDTEIEWHPPATCTHDRQPQVSDAAIQVCLTMKVLFGMPLRQTTGFVEDLLRLAGLGWRVPDFSTLRRRRKTLDIAIPYRGGSLANCMFEQLPDVADFFSDCLPALCLPYMLCVFVDEDGNLRSEGLPVDIKTGARSYVEGPLSQRPDGGFYDPVKGLPEKDALPHLLGSAIPTSAPILTGHRHVELVKEAVRMVELVDSAEELQANLAGIRDDWCADPETMPDSELRGIAEWACKCRLENSIYIGRDSAFPVHRMALDALRGQPNGTDAIALYVVLSDQHGHNPDKRFPLNFQAIRDAGLIQLSTRRFRSARRVLENEGLLKRVSNHRAGSRPQTFVLTRLRPSSSEADNVTDLPNAQREG